MGRAFEFRKARKMKRWSAMSKAFTRIGKDIVMAVKEGGPDPDGNLALRGLIERAKKDQVPTHVIEKAISKAQGAGGEDFSVARYEGFGPGGCMVIVDCLTDNPNRTFGDVRQCFTKTKCKIGTEGTVSHMFDHSCILAFKGDDEEAALEALLMADVDVTDIESDDGKITIFAPNTEYFKVKKALTEAFGDIDFEVDEIQFLPKAHTPITGDDVEMFEKFLDMLNDLDDVQNIYHDAEL